MIERLLSRLHNQAQPPSPLAGHALSDGLMRRVGVEGIRIGISGDPSADRQISRLLRESRALGSKERRLVSDTLYGAVRDRRTLDCLLQIGGLTQVSPHALWSAHLVATHSASPDLAAQEIGVDCFQPSVDPAATMRAWYERTNPTASTAIAILGSIPGWLASRLVEQYGPDNAADLTSALNQRAPTTLRANQTKTDRTALSSLLSNHQIHTEEGRLTPNAIHVLDRANLRELAAFREGLFEIQDEASQLVAELVEPPQGGSIVDFCSGAGGKALAIASQLPRRARVVGFDIRRPAIEEARKRARRAGCPRTEFHLINPQGALPIPPQSAHRVLVDVPCSGTGRLRRQPSARWSLTEDAMASLTQTQADILKRASSLVRPRGRLIYATCSLLQEENQAIVDAFLQDHPQWTVLPIKEVLGRQRARMVGDGTTLNTRPDQHGTDGFFAAILTRQDRGASSGN